MVPGVKEFIAVIPPKESAEIVNHGAVWYMASKDDSWKTSKCSTLPAKTVWIGFRMFYESLWTISGYRCKPGEQTQTITIVTKFYEMKLYSNPWLGWCSKTLLNKLYCLILMEFLCVEPPKINNFWARNIKAHTQTFHECGRYVGLPFLLIAVSSEI